MNELPAASPGTITPRIENLSAVLLPDKKRGRASLVLNDASSRPTVEFKLLDLRQDMITQSTIIGVFENTVNFTLHLGNESADTLLQVVGSVILNDTEVMDSKQVEVELSA